MVRFFRRWENNAKLRFRALGGRSAGRGQDILAAASARDGGSGFFVRDALGWAKNREFPQEKPVLARISRIFSGLRHFSDCIFPKSDFNHHVRFVGYTNFSPPETSHGGLSVMAKAAAKKAPTKTEIMQSIATATDLSKKQVAAVIEALAAEIKKSLSARGAGVFAIPGLVKVERKKVPAKPARKNAPDPFHPGEFRDYPAKPASVKVKVRALKNLKDMVQ
jgi:nucleoid DNA-binding protein